MQQSLTADSSFTDQERNPATALTHTASYLKPFTPSPPPYAHINTLTCMPGSQQVSSSIKIFRPKCCAALLISPCPCHTSSRSSRNLETSCCRLAQPNAPRTRCNRHFKLRCVTCRSRSGSRTAAPSGRGNTQTTWSC